MFSPSLIGTLSKIIKVFKIPQFTIGIPVYNRLDYFKETLKSVLNQDFTDFEIVIVDDFSTDGTREYLDSLKDPRIKVFKNKENVGIVRNWKKCIEYATGKWFKFLMSDDLMFPYNLSILNELINLFPTNNTIVVSGTGFTDFEKIKTYFTCDKPKIENPGQYLVDMDLIIDRRKRFIQTWANPAAYTLPASDLKELLESENYRIVESILGNTGHCVDYFLLYAVALKYKTMIEIDIPLYGIRYHETNLSKGYSRNLFYHLKGDRLVHYLLYNYKGIENFYIIRHAFKVYIHKIKNKREILTLSFILKAFQLIGFIFYHFFLTLKNIFKINGK